MPTFFRNQWQRFQSYHVLTKPWANLDFEWVKLQQQNKGTWKQTKEQTRKLQKEKEMNTLMVWMEENDAKKVVKIRLSFLLKLRVIQQWTIFSDDLQMSLLFI